LCKRTLTCLECIAGDMQWLCRWCSVCVRLCRWRCRWLSWSRWNTRWTRNEFFSQCLFLS